MTCYAWSALPFQFGAIPYDILTIPCESWRFLAIPSDSWRFIAVHRDSEGFLAIPGDSSY